MTISRRNFIMAGSLLLTTGYFLKRSDYINLISDTIFHRLGYLKLDPNNVRLFAEDYADKYQKSTTKILSIDFARTVVNVFPWIDKLNDRIEEFESYIVTKFLKNSDYFSFASDPSSFDRTVKYLGLNYASPYEIICSNPFARFDFD